MKIRKLYDLNLGISQIVDTKMPAPVAYKIDRNHAKISEELEPVEEQRKKLADREDREKADAEFGEILDEDVDIDLKKISINELSNVDIKPSDLALLSDIIKEENDE